ncbi:methyltransferase regulatory domain-containing protein [Stella sp.]|uniref:class I SAM-dependent methyltransferase n=1 Tax=Stella sp. TaxID=2912054 RepID=UPI0035AD8E4C
MSADDIAFATPYTNHYFSSLSPAMLRFVPLLHRQHAGPSVLAANGGDRFTYAEFGCGQALSLLIMAAANPNATFYGVDYSPAHIARARAMADRAGLANVVLLERAFEDLRPDELPPLDFATMHGIWSWVPNSTRDALIGLLDRHLKPGGTLYVSYNTLTTWTGLLPVQKLLYDYAEQATGSPEDRARKALDFLESLIAINAGHFKNAKALSEWLKQTKSGDIRYVLHEYFVRHWEPTPHSEVARRMERAKLSYVGTTDLVDTIDRFTMTPETAKALGEVPAGSIRETVSDLLRSNSFRRDIYVRGPVPMTPAEWRQRTRRQRFAMIRLRERCNLSVKFPIGTVELNEQAFRPILDRLAAGPATLAEVAAEAGDTQDSNLVRRVVTMVAAGYVYPASAVDADPGPSQRLNRVIADEIAAGHAHDVLASPVLGSGVRMAASRIVDFAAGKAPPEEGSQERKDHESERATMARLRVGFAPG